MRVVNPEGYGNAIPFRSNGTLTSLYSVSTTILSFASIGSLRKEEVVDVISLVEPKLKLLLSTILPTESTNLASRNVFRCFPLIFNRSDVEDPLLL